MKNFVSVTVLALVVGMFFTSCSTMMTVHVADPEGNPIPGAAVAINDRFIGYTPTTVTEVSDFIVGRTRIRVTKEGFTPTEVLAVRRVRIVNIIAAPFTYGISLLWMRPHLRNQHITLMHGGRPTATGVVGAVERAADDVARNFTARSRIAIVHMEAGDRGTTDFVTGELEHILQGRGFVIVDRSELDRIRAEQLLGLGGEVDDSTAASIGQFAGASVVITGGVDGEGVLRRLRLRALYTTTAQVVGTASEAF